MIFRSGSDLPFLSVHMLSISPVIALCKPTLSTNSPFIFCNAGYRICFTNVVLPLPLTPLTTHNTFKGNSTVIFFRLCCLAPSTFMERFHLRTFLEVQFSIRLFRYLPVRLLCIINDFIIISFRHHFTTQMTGKRPHVNDMIRFPHHHFIMFYHHHGISKIPQILLIL